LRQREDRQALNDRLLEPGQSFALWARALGTLMPALDVVDLGCGSGALTVEIARWARSVLAVDRNELALRAAKERVAREGLANVKFRHADLCDLDAAQDAPPHGLAVASQSLHFAEEPEGILRSARRLLKRGGRLLVLELLPHSEEWVRERLGHVHLGFEPKLLAERVQSQGFKDVTWDVPHQSQSAFRVFLLRGVSR
jgi:ArsR family transcriptional regulator